MTNTISIVVFFGGLSIQLNYGGKKRLPWGYMSSIHDEFLHLFHRSHYIWCAFFRFSAHFICIVYACDVGRNRHYSVCRYLVVFSSNPFSCGSNTFFSFLCVCCKFSVVIVLVLMRIENRIQATAN